MQTKRHRLFLFVCFDFLFCFCFVAFCREVFFTVFIFVFCLFCFVFNFSLFLLFFAFWGEVFFTAFIFVFCLFCFFNFFFFLFILFSMLLILFFFFLSQFRYFLNENTSLWECNTLDNQQALDPCNWKFMSVLMTEKNWRNIKKYDGVVSQNIKRKGFKRCFDQQKTHWNKFVSSFFFFSF